MPQLDKEPKFNEGDLVEVIEPQDDYTGKVLWFFEGRYGVRCDWCGEVHTAHEQHLQLMEASVVE